MQGRGPGLKPVAADEAFDTVDGTCIHRLRLPHNTDLCPAFWTFHDAFSFEVFVVLMDLLPALDGSNEEGGGWPGAATQPGRPVVPLVRRRFCP